MKQTWVIISIIIVSFLMLFGIVVYASQGSSAANITPTANAKAIVMGETYLDWGTISMADGDAEASFKVVNEGTEALQLFNPITSCTCTTVQLIKGDEKSVPFSMHTKTKYAMQVLPGEEVEVKVVFDPAFHGPGGVGAITRQVTLETNDASSPSLSFSLAAVVTK